MSFINAHQIPVPVALSGQYALDATYTVPLIGFDVTVVSGASKSIQIESTNGTQVTYTFGTGDSYPRRVFIPIRKIIDAGTDTLDANFAVTGLKLSSY